MNQGLRVIFIALLLLGLLQGGCLSNQFPIHKLHERSEMREPPLPQHRPGEIVVVVQGETFELLTGQSRADRIVRQVDQPVPPLETPGWVLNLQKRTGIQKKIQKSGNNGPNEDF